MSVRLAINPITWSNDDMPSLGGDTPLQTCLAEARQAGFEGIELGNKFPREPQALRAELDAFGLTLASGWYSARLLERSAEAEIAAVQPHLELLHALGAPVMVFCETTGCVHGDRDAPLSRRPVLGAGDWRRFCARLNRVAEHLAGQGVPMAYHHHMGTVVETEAEVDRLMADTDEHVGLLLDTGHLAYAGGDPVAVAERHGRRINHLHTKDLRADVVAAMQARDSSFLDAVLAGAFTVPGDGSLDFRAVLEALRAWGYAGWIVVEAEQDPARAHPLTYACLGHDTLSRLVAETGIGRPPGA
ncbi:myo-inosose-2 dehydratase [Sediminicurvatus halobius]|uniref:Myo-inosose-2 dehydratase n=1 Tax=Sediminicurvatus halobius TaxID=2182432 RepID=A0A2U2N775_9GAMM|nr:myo-inosose-2 dehydratase [Spiribacter halobius]PWG64952.1 myo-inosose-2 dehydratase [Spiribacter halobius]UEX78191.1 myo-inosose-2 dehydratase [Spiribacter halobius]